MSDLDPAAAIESLYDRGVTDGLPVVPPTRALIERAVAATGRDAGELVAVVPPNYGRATVEKVAINAVMAGCRPNISPSSSRRSKPSATRPSISMVFRRRRTRPRRS